MEHLNKTATAIFKSLISQLHENYLKLDNSADSFMPVSFERLETIPAFLGGKACIYSLAHYYEQNGDLMADPEMTFFVCDTKTEFLIYPASFRQDNLGIYEESIFKQASWKYSPKFQKQHTLFANMWLRNIKYQQGL